MRECRAHPGEKVCSAADVERARGVVMGRSRSSPANTMKALAVEANTTSAWTLLGATGALAGLLILSFYSVAAGWALSYVFNGFQDITAESSTSSFNALLSSPSSLIFWHTLFLSITVFVVARGILDGLEKWINTLMPMLFVKNYQMA